MAQVGPSRPGTHLLPYVVASSKAGTWAEVLKAYQRCWSYLKGVCPPTAEELNHGLAQMPSSWATSLFYYGLVKDVYPTGRPDHSVVSRALNQFKRAGNYPAMRRLFNEDVNTHTLQGAQSSLVLACYAGMWEDALLTMQRQPKLRNSSANRRLVINALSAVGHTKDALAVLRSGPSADLSPTMIRPIVKRLSHDSEHAAALRLTADAFADGHSLTVSLFSAILQSLRGTGQSQIALETAMSLNLFAMPRAEAQQNVAMFNGLVGCLYDCDPYASDYSVHDVVQETTARMNPKEMTYRPTARRRQQFRLRTSTDIHKQFAKYVQPMNQVYGRIIGLPRWYAKPLLGLVDLVESTDATLLVLDTNFLIQCVSKNLPLEHFRSSMDHQYPHLRGRTGGVVVVIPFTAVEEAYTLIWNRSNRLRHSVRLLLWSRVAAFTRQPQVYVLTLGTELPAMSLSILTRMAYAKATPTDGTFRGSDENMDEAAEPGFAVDRVRMGSNVRDPDARILNVCVYFQHMLRYRAVAATQGSSIPEGTALFALLKYHVRRYTNTVKGSASDRLILCTMDKKLSHAAAAAGVDCFPVLR